MLDGWDNMVSFAKGERLVKFTDFHSVYQSEAFFYRLLLFSKPCSEEEFLPCDGSYFKECVRHHQLGGLGQVLQEIR